MAALGEREPTAGRVERMVARHGAAVLRVATQFSLCHDDALDAYQRAFEIYLRRLDSVDPATEGAWLRVVVKHEAMAIRRARLASVGHDDADLDATVHGELREVDDAVAGGERVSRSVEALHALKPDEARALLLKAEGHSYQEIGKRFGWSYTKVNRSITEGRARFMKVFRGIERGEECARHEATLNALAAGTATSAELVAIRPHLRHCAACRATVRELRISRTRRIALWLPVGWLVRLLSRSDVALYTSAGGGRLGPAAAILGICVSGVGAGAACVMTGALPAPPIIAHSSAPEPTPAPRKASKPRKRAPAPRRAEPLSEPRRVVTAAAATPTPAATAAPKRERSKPARRERPKQRDAKRDDGEFGFEGSAGSTAPPPQEFNASVASAASAGGGSSGGGSSGGRTGSAPKGTSGSEFGFEG